MRYAVNATPADIERAMAGPVAWDVAAYAGLLSIGGNDVSVEALAPRHRMRLDRRPRRGPRAGQGATHPEVAQVLRVPVSSSAAEQRWRGALGPVQRALGRIVHTDVVVTAPGVDALISHLRHVISVRPGVGLVRTTNGVIPELWSWRPPPEAERVHRAHVSREVMFSARADQVVCWTEYGADNLVHAGVAPDRISVASPVLQLAAPTGPDVPTTHLVRAVFVSGAAWLKGLPEALAAVSEVPGAELHVVGGVIPRDPPPRTTWHGALPAGRVARLLESADILLAPARQETFGVSFVEAMRAGLAVVGSTIGTVAELVGEAGRLVPPGDAPATTDALRDLVEDPTSRQGLGRAARDRYDACFAPAVAVRAWERLLA